MQPKPNIKLCYKPSVDSCGKYLFIQKLYLQLEHLAFIYPSKKFMFPDGIREWLAAE